MRPGLGFSRRNYPLRIFGMALAFPCVASVFLQHHVPWHFWIFAGFTGFAWPHLAYFLARRSASAVDAEYRNLGTDAALAGLSLPLVSFNVLPVVVLLAMIGMVMITVGGWRLFNRGMVQMLGFALLGSLWAVLVWNEYSVRLEPSLMTLLASTPLMIAFPVCIGVMTYRMARRLSRQRSELERLSQRDGLSQLFNRQHWEELLFLEHERHKRYGTVLSLMMIDIDDFKTINDSYGHVTGDELIREFCALLTAHLRQSDIAGRYGGDEFGVLLPGTDLEGALLLAERLRLMAQTLLVGPREVKFTISVGVAESIEDMPHYAQLVECADKALYEAKHSGRNFSAAYRSGD